MTPPPSTAGIVTQPNALLPSVKSELLDLMKTVIEKCSQQISLQLLEVGWVWPGGHVTCGCG